MLGRYPWSGHKVWKVRKDIEFTYRDFEFEADEQVLQPYGSFRSNFQMQIYSTSIFE